MQDEQRDTAQAQVDRVSNINTFAAQVANTCAEITALDAEIATLERELVVLPDVLRLLAGHPVLWLVLGREGIDRPGTLGRVVGQQVVTVVRRDRAALCLMGVGMLLGGLAIGLVLATLFQGGL